MKISIILPTYCERDNIIDLLQALDYELSLESWDIEILVIDDNSPDGTGETVLSYISVRGKHDIKSDIQCIIRKDERGLATAIKTGIRQCSGEVIVVMDTDFNHDPAMVPQMIKFLEYYDLIIGSRFVVGGGMESRKRYFFSLIYNIFIRMMLRLQVQDNLSGFFAIRRNRFLELDFDNIFFGYGEYFIRLLFEARINDIKILEVPVFYILRRHGKSKSQFVRMLVDYTKCVLMLWIQKIYLIFYSRGFIGNSPLLHPKNRT